ncbi:hypothetical protein Ais01nite_67630 [Asanoa ishikariensis]|nr:hypothetical protein Ais01nite_67630 [Asanoa ishikariensis]
MVNLLEQLTHVVDCEDDPKGRGTTPLGDQRTTTRSLTAVTGRTRPVLLRSEDPFFRRLTGDGRVIANCTQGYLTGNNVRARLILAA